MTIQEPNETQSENWKSTTYILGAAIGTLFGLVSAYLYTRAAEESAERQGKPERIPTGQLIGISLGLLGLIRQIAEMGKPSDKK